MLKWIESTGKTEDAAIEAALVKLGMDRDEVSVEVLERAKTGFLGIGSCPAKVKVTYEAPDEPEPAPAPQKAKQPDMGAEQRAAVKDPPPEEPINRPAEAPAAAASAVDYDRAAAIEAF